MLEAIKRLEQEKVVAVISPVWETGEKIDWKDYAQLVEFDVAVTTQDKLPATGRGALKVLSVVDLSAEGSKSHERSNLNRVKFGVTIIPPLKSTGRYVEERRASL